MHILTICILLVFAFAGCSKEQAKRAAFETLQNIKAQDCDDRLVDGCGEGEKFDTYQRERQEVLNPAE
ncbi:MAG: hypothetical protein KKD73_01845 [Proteobacteria bacterium]|nr:hypothetical protein [Pseudomonadota bacterium]MBU1640113.1 hypothetical protein [Pseudomonadota bacterium]